ncbi:Cyclic peptide transporter [Purpureocillium lavendulum]|uniref:Cyclic peptide transporter n=1 Tax=Purpureocillium lavendulum TaxID=1247861 RepID=A0AB34FWS3_9HYPO|nr:Cyclic peptide transporter [Purpureocillium lavendulum]
MNHTSAAADAAFGPQLTNHFDFTLVFEQSILSIGPSVVLLLASAVRITLLSKRPFTFRTSNLLWAKLVNPPMLPVSQFYALLIHQGCAAAVVSAVGDLAIGSLLYAEHRHSYSPSILLSLYLSVTILFDIATVRSLFLRRDLRIVGAVSAATLLVKLILLVLEEVPKRDPSTSKTSQELSSGLWNRSVFWWLRSTFHQGFTAFLGVDDLPTLDQGLDTASLGSRLEKAWNSVNRSGKHCLAVATWSAFKTTFWSAVLPRLCFTGFTFAQPFLINTIIDFIGSPAAEHAQRGAVAGLIGATALVYFGIAFSRCHYMHRTYRLITAVRGGMVTLIFSKALDLDVATAKESAAVTLMSTDIDGIAAGLQKVHDIWSSVIELGLGIYLLQRQVGAACFLIVIPGVLSSFATARVARGMGPARVLWNSKVQTRVTTTSATLSHIKGLKIMGLSDRISKLIQSLRVVELDSSKTFPNLSDQLTPILIIAAAVFWTKGSQGLSIAEAFTSLSIVTLVSTPIVNIIAAYPSFVAGLACFGRIQAFMLGTDRTEYRSLPPSSNASTFRAEFQGENVELDTVQGGTAPRERASLDAAPAIHIQKASFALHCGDNAVLHAIDLTIRPGELTMIVGPVGSGKSTLLKAILGEARLLSGQIHLTSGPVAYCDQTAWLRLGSVRDNILGPNAFDGKWYATVLRACALEKDVALLGDGDLTSVGSGGNALSGGQKQRVCLARAVYSRCPILLLDNVFSALDQQTSRDVFARLLGPDGLLRKSKRTVLLATHALECLSSADTVVALNRAGSVVSQTVPSDMNLNEEYMEALGMGGDVTVTDDAQDAGPATTSPGKQPSTPELTRKIGDMSLYKFYLQSCGVFLFVIWLALAAGYIFSGKLPQIWLRIWTEHGTTNHAEVYFGGYLAFGVICTVLSGSCVYFFMIVAVPKSAQFAGRAPLWFFTSTDTSTVLNRFSQDMTLVDQVLPTSVFTTTFDVYNVIAGAALIASGATYVAAIIPVCAGVIYFIQKFYLRTSRQMRHLDLEAKSPLYRLFTETAAGIITVRAFGWKRDMAEENLELLDHSQRPYYTMYCIQRWLNVVLDLLVAAIAIVLVGFALGFSNTATQGSIGLALINVMEFNQSLSMLINSWTGLETSLGAIARLKSFIAETKTEDLDMEHEMPPADWPRRGAIELKNVTAKYNAQDAQSQPAVRNVDLTILPGQKVAVIGRTGSGKSSLILTLLHLLDVEAGHLTIDGLDVSRMPRQALRSAIVTIPQDSPELPGSVRDNLALFDSSSASEDNGEDHVMQQALRRVGLWEVVSEQGGLEAELDDVGLSAGQKQLFSLARALLVVRKRRASGGVVLMDEPTSSLDEETDARMRSIVADEFKDYTVLVVSHRLDAAKDADVVVRVDGGSVVEVVVARG